MSVIERKEQQVKHHRIGFVFALAAFFAMPASRLQAANQVLALGAGSSSVNCGFVPVFTSPNQTGQMTIEFWMRRESGSVNGRPFNMRGCSCSGITVQANVVGAGGRLRAEIGGFPDWEGIPFELGTWHHFALVWTRFPGVLRLYQNGELAGQQAIASGASVSFCGQEPLRLGSQCGLGIVGAMDNVRYWSVARTQAQILADMERQYSPEEAQSTAGLLGSWTFEDGTALNGAGTSPAGVLEGGAAIVVEEFGPFSCPADINNDDSVNGADISVLLGYWGQTGKLVPGDINRDGTVDAQDLSMLLGSWGPCPN